MRITKFEKAQKFRTTNRALQGVLFCSACLLAFVLAWKQLPLIDLTSDGRYSLTPETTAYLRTLTKEVEIIGSLSLGETGALGPERLHELQDLVERYAAAGSQLKVKWVDGFRAQSEFGFENPNQILVRSDEHKVWIRPEELYANEEDAFTGEMAITSALWRIINPAKRTVILVANKEKLETESSWGFKRLIEFFTARNSTVRLLSPDELALQENLKADALLVLGSSDKLDEANLASLQRAINDHQAHVLLAIDEPPSEAMVRFLYFNGLNWTGSRAAEGDSQQKTAAGEVLVKDFTRHPVTETVIKNNLRILSRGYWWTLIARAPLVDAAATPLAQSPPPTTDTQTGPQILSYAIEKKHALGNATRISVWGGSDWLSNAYLPYKGNQTLLEGLNNWLTGSSSLLSIPPRLRQARQLGISGSQLWQIGTSIAGCCVVLWGVGVVRWIVRPR